MSMRITMKMLLAQGHKLFMYIKFKNVTYSVLVTEKQFQKKKKKRKEKVKRRRQIQFAENSNRCKKWPIS